MSKFIRLSSRSVWRGIPPIFPDAVVQSAWLAVVLLHLDAAGTSFWVREDAVGLTSISGPSERLQAQLTGRVGRILDRPEQRPF